MILEEQRFLCRLECKHLFCGHLAKTGQLTINIFRIVGQWLKIYNLFFLFFLNFWVMRIRATNAQGPQSLKTWHCDSVLLLSLSRLADSLSNCDSAYWKSGEEGNVNQVQLGFLLCLVTASRLCRIPNPHLLN